MWRRARGRGSLALLVALAGACDDGDEPIVAPDAFADEAQRLIILHSNDEHSHLFGFAPEVDDYPLTATPGTGAIVGSAARRATLLDELRAQASSSGADTITVSSGDQMFGALPQVALATTAPDFVAMQALGYDVMCPGNHEFDLGPAAYAASILAAYQRGGMPIIVSSNIVFDPDDPDDDALAQLFGEGTSSKLIKRYHVHTTPSGLRVGFIGIMGANAAAISPGKPPVRFSGDPDGDETDLEAVMPYLFADIQAVVDTVRAEENVDVLIALSHAGVDLLIPERGEDYQIAANVTGIDLIISGHTHQILTEPQLVTAPDGHEVPIVEAGEYGKLLGRIEISVRPGERPVWEPDPDRTGILPIDDTLVPELDTFGPLLDGVVRDLEEPQDGETTSWLEDAITRVEGTSVQDDPDLLGDLYYRSMGTTSFDIPDHSGRESNIANLTADSMVWAAELYEGPVAMAMRAKGSVRDPLLAGSSGTLSFADLFRVLPFGEDPVDGSAGYPLVVAYLNTIEMKAAFEITADLGLQFNATVILPAGARVEYDTDRPAQDLTDPINALDPENGRVTRILIDADHTDGLDGADIAVFDLDRGAAAWDSALGDAATLHPIVTNLHVALFAEAAGIRLKRADGTPFERVEDAFLVRPDGSIVKDWEAFMTYVRLECEANAGMLPTRYDENTPEGAIPRRLICTGALCR